MKYKQQLSTKSYFVNRFKKLSTSFLFWQIQDIAWEHAEQLGFGFDNLKKDKQFWVLSRLLVKIKRRPSWGEKFTVETWPVGLEGLLALRDIEFIDEKGESIIQATTSWLVLDQQTKRIIRLEDLYEIPSNTERVLNQNAGKVRPPKSAEELIFSPALFNEIDVNQHFNSGRYLERIIDSYDFDFHETNELTEFEVNFVKEGIPSDQLAVKKQIIDKNNHICSVVRQSDGADLIRARLVWSLRQ
ncbi:acyl-ACP thioesterase domain-containing protein [uncultured Draconibacterium sp.]|uniref:acyl-[acyl-carrier-protein] thioesterase n=1 Tax=uncultured Draconibacterium sp. TaxID=1573823 RepID=UPI0025DC88BC|nr:acyl-ACP thioesterase domain-containing protein [uncultured Draconibacterium sp.]